MTTNQVADDLRAAKALIEERGWTQGSWKEEDGRLCLLSAVGEATGGWSWLDGMNCLNPKECERYDAARQAFYAVVGSGGIRFNDAKGRTKDDVLDALERAAVLAETEGRVVV